MSVIERLLRRDGEPSADSRLVVRPMRRRDLTRGVMAIEAVSYPRPWTKGVFDGELSQVKSGSRYYVVAQRRLAQRGRGAGDDVVGYAGVWFTDTDAHVTNVAVRPSQQRRGVATHLMLALADEAIRRRATAWTLEVRSSSLGAQELYRGFGFVPAGVRQRYYENTEDAIVMWCSDIQSSEYAATLDAIRDRLRAPEVASGEGSGAAT